MAAFGKTPARRDNTADGDLTALTAMQAAEAIRSRRITSLEYVEALLAHADEWSVLNVFITPDGDRLRDEARRVDERIAAGLDVGPLAGVPLAIKDNIHTAGVRTTAGTAALQGFVPDADATVLRKLVAADALRGGKTNMFELARWPSGENSTYGDVRNPHDLGRTSGGSSSGTAAAVAAGIFPAGLGSDTGGSCRIPAALCGCVGFRPTSGRYSQDGLIMLSPTLDTIGLLARTVSDIEFLDSICANEPAQNQDVGLRGIRIGVPGNLYRSLDADLGEVVEGALDILRDAGAVLINDAIDGLDPWSGSTILSYESPRELEAFLERNGLCPLDEFLSTLRDASIPSMGAISDDEYGDALNRRRFGLQRAYASYFSRHELSGILMPTTHRPAGPTDSVSDASNTYPPSIAGLPCLSIPVGLTRGTNLPVGMELVGPRGTDGVFLGLGRAVEEAVGFIPAPVPS